MSVTFSAVRPRGKGEITQQTIQKMLDENHHLIQCIMDYQSKGKTSECKQYQQILHRNLVYLATIADSNQNMQSLLPAPPNPNLNIGPVGGGQSLHSQTNMNNSMGTGLPPTSLMQSQMSNGPSHALTQQQPSTSMSHGTRPGYSHSAPTSQGQVAYSSMASRANLNMQSSQVSMMHQQGTGSHYSSTSAGGQHYQGQQTGIMAQGNQGNSIMSQRPMGSYCVPQQEQILSVLTTKGIYYMLLGDRNRKLIVTVAPILNTLQGNGSGCLPEISASDSHAESSVP
ncbi:calcium-responsive transactivator, partial [Sinocyclocheilus anshuiensis]|uniref:calcium-responsive transactivator n=1 Tax=Sinocyclocheilus anshuiensis TaxID=1608454 RepID=UPI0007B9B742